ncbi:right-handed parallel beta-helix repeat-containing protein [Haloferax larsenii]|uniref:Pel9A-like right handed beta-helix region domain-containing protein n=1 Tax=Haloferax larsenii TaxID=302484 RepID=A0A1H7IL90_HALLR|nr:right-handed parallel beta-helix repeat-containing protein [Haloferax larsenii]SEK63239.1 hypothetical protein SAMN04488691_101939 [Haloferax larsenii]
MPLHSRRSFLAGAAALGTLALAGCGGRATEDTVTTETPATPTRTDPVTETPEPNVVDPEDAENVYYVDPRDGSDDNSGDSADSPFETLRPVMYDAEFELGAGDVVYLRGGVHKLRGDGSINLSYLTGTEEKPITIQAFPGERPVIDVNMKGSNGISMFGSEHVHLRGFELKNVKRNGIACSESNDGPAKSCVFEDLEIHHYGQGDDRNGNGISFYGHSFDHFVRRVTAHHGGSKNSSDGFYIGGEGDRLSGGHRFEECVAYLNADDGFDFYRSDPTRGSLVVNSVAYKNGTDGNGTTGDGNGFKMGGGWETGGNRCYRCVAYDNTAYGFDNNGASVPNTYDHCTSFRNGTFGFSFTGNTEPDNLARNSLAWLNGEGAVFQAFNVRSERNSWDLDIDNPEFARTVTGDDFLRLTKGSPCIDAGVDIGEPYLGAAPDLGAFEFT